MAPDGEWSLQSNLPLSPADNLVSGRSISKTTRQLPLGQDCRDEPSPVSCSRNLHLAPPPETPLRRVPPAIAGSPDKVRRSQSHPTPPEPVPGMRKFRRAFLAPIPGTQDQRPPSGSSPRLRDAT